ncbi:MAG: adenylate/guanylate cyclase domain-containing protein [Gemmataceae bacterium]|nr:adenylate/guanylate cyclase domain-containing protein [Gemmataceae bacterium]
MSAETGLHSALATEPRGTHTSGMTQADPSALSRAAPETLELALNRAVLRNERLRGTLVIELLLLVLVTTAPFYPMMPAVDGWDVKRHWPIAVTTFVLLIALVIGWEWLVRRWAGKFLQTNHPPVWYYRYLTAMVETGLPTSTLVLAMLTLDPLHALSLPISFFYYAFIALSTLSLRFDVCVFTGLLSSAQFLALSLGYMQWFAPKDVVTHHRLLSASFLGHGLLLCVTGFVAGRVAMIIREQFVNALRSTEERNQVREVFGKYTSPQVVDQLLMQKVDLAGEVRRVCVMFLDIRDFTRYSNSRRPEEVVQYLNRVFEPMIESINRHHGMINKFLGDGFMAVFGAPTSDGRDVQNAVAAAMAILADVERLNAGGTVAATRIGIGLHAGEAVVGTVGSAVRKEYTVIGDTVNLASRVEQLNKQLQSQLLVTEPVWCAVHADFPKATDHGPVPVKGAAAPVRVYQLV